MDSTSQTLAGRETYKVQKTPSGLGLNIRKSITMKPNKKKDVRRISQFVQPMQVKPWEPISLNEIYDQDEMYIDGSKEIVQDPMPPHI